MKHSLRVYSRAYCVVQLAGSLRQPLARKASLQQLGHFHVRQYNDAVALQRARELRGQHVLALQTRRALARASIGKDTRDSAR